VASVGPEGIGRGDRLDRLTRVVDGELS